MRQELTTTLIAVIALTATSLAQSPAQSAPEGRLPAIDPIGPTLDDGRGTPYVVDKSDNICGIDEPRAITNPATVNYQALLDATPEVKLIKRRKIDKESAEGIRLMTKARRKVLAACESVRSSKSYCSVWKKIKRRDKRPVPDITSKVKAEIQGGEEEA